MYFPFFILHDWDKRSAEARSSHCAVLHWYYGVNSILVVIPFFNEVTL